MRALIGFMVIGCVLGLGETGLGIEASSERPKVFFEAVYNEPISSKYLQVPQDIVLYNFRFQCFDRQGNLVGQRFSDNGFVRLSPAGKILNNRVVSLATPATLGRFVGVDSLDRFWFLQNNGSEKDDQKQAAGTKFVLYDKTGKVLKEIQPNWVVLHENKPDDYYGDTRYSRDAEKMKPDEIPLGNYYGISEATMLFNREIYVYGIDNYSYFLNLKGELIRRTTARNHDAFGYEYEWKYWAGDSSGEVFLWGPPRADKTNLYTPGKDIFALEDFKDDTTATNPRLNWIDANRKGYVAFRNTDRIPYDYRWGTRWFEYVLVDGRTGQIVTHNAFRWNADTTTTSEITQVMLTERNELLVFATEGQEIGHGILEFELTGGGVYPHMDEVDPEPVRPAKPKFDKTYFRIYKIPNE